MNPEQEPKPEPEMTQYEKALDTVVRMEFAWNLPIMENATIIPVIPRLLTELRQRRIVEMGLMTQNELTLAMRADAKKQDKFEKSQIKYGQKKKKVSHLKKSDRFYAQHCKFCNEWEHADNTACCWWFFYDYMVKPLVTDSDYTEFGKWFENRKVYPDEPILLHGQFLNGIRMKTKEDKPEVIKAYDDGSARS